MNQPFDAIIFDLDGVITDTAEYHFRGWQRLAQEEGLAFSRADNEQLRGVPRRESLARILAGRPIDEPMAEAWMARKNDYYQAMIADMSPADLLPGVPDLLREIRAAGLKMAIASASRNAPEVIERLGIAGYFDALAHGGSVTRQKPAPDLFLFVAEQLGLPPERCLIVEDAQAGIEAAHAAGMAAVGIGPRARVGAAEVVLPSLDGATLDDLAAAVTWRVVETEFVPAQQHHQETILTLGNGYLATRGSLEEGYPGDSPATFVHGVWDAAPIVATELANAPRWTDLAIWVDGHRFDMRAEQIDAYSRTLDLRQGCLRRHLRWTTPDGVIVDLRFERFAALDDEHALALRAVITPLNREAEVRVRALLDAHVENRGLLHWHTVDQAADDRQADLLVRTRQSDRLLAMSARLEATGQDVQRRGVDCPGSPGLTVTARQPAGQACVVDKLVAVYTARDGNDPAAAARAKAAALATAGYEALRAGSTAAWARFWDRSDVVIRGDNEAQQALRHALFQLRIAAPAHDERVSIGAKTLSGFGYHGHVFWDTEIFVLPFFTYTHPDIARNMLLYRYHALPGARRKAAANGFRGAQFPWESAETGDEVTPPWVPHFGDTNRLVRIWTGDIEIHISSDVAYAAHQYWQATGDDAFWRDYGVPMVLETAVFWADRAEPEDGRYALRDVVGPDEYHEHVDNNIYTNVMAQWHLETALAALGWLQDAAPQQAAALTERLGLTPDRLDRWRDIIAHITILQDPDTGLMEQFEGFFGLRALDWPAYADRSRSMQEILGIEGANEAQVLKQPDAIALLALLGDRYDRAVWEANWAYYAPITDHTYGSSLGPAMHAWVAARLGRIDEAYDHFMRAARADLQDVRGNAGDGIHAASAGGLWEAAVFGFAGLVITPDGPALAPAGAPALPAHWRELAFPLYYHGQRYQIRITHEGGEVQEVEDPADIR
jgi:kojibiose phosphorylase